MRVRQLDYAPGERRSMVQLVGAWIFLGLVVFWLAWIICLNVWGS